MTIKYNLSAQPKRERKAQFFDREKIFVVKKGQKINVYDAIQEANVDTDIYKTLEKYGSIESMKKLNEPLVIQEFEKLLSLTDIIEINQKADELWEQLPAGVREEFHGDKNELLQRGEDWLKQHKKPEQPTEQPIEQPTEKTQIKEDK